MSSEGLGGVPSRRPPGASDEVVAAVGKLTEALEWVERARGHLFDLHQQTGHADGLLGEAIDALRAAGHHATADQLTADLLGRNVIGGRWTFQLVEEFDEGYYAAWRRAEDRVRARLLGGARHVREAELKAEEQDRAACARARRAPGG